MWWLMNDQEQDVNKVSASVATLLHLHIQSVKFSDAW